MSDTHLRVHALISNGELLTIPSVCAYLVSHAGQGSKEYLPYTQELGTHLDGMKCSSQGHKAEPH